jgi:hypothetical protein
LELPIILARECEEVNHYLEVSISGTDFRKKFLEGLFIRKGKPITIVEVIIYGNNTVTP